MAEEQSKGIQQIEGCEVIYDMGSGLVIAKVPLDKVKEQDINARIMKNEIGFQPVRHIHSAGTLQVCVGLLDCPVSLPCVFALAV